MNQDVDPRQESVNSRPAPKRPPFVRKVVSLKGYFVAMRDEIDRKLAADRVVTTVEPQVVPPPPVPPLVQSSGNSPRGTGVDTGVATDPGTTSRGIPEGGSSSGVPQRGVASTAGLGENVVGVAHHADVAGVPGGADPGGPTGGGDSPAPIIECKETRNVIIPGIEGMITAVRIRIDNPRVYQEFRDNKDFLEATTSKTSINVEGSAVPVVVNSPLEPIMPLTCNKKSVINSELVRDSLMRKMGVDGFVKGVMTIEARIDVTRYREIATAIERIDTLRTALPFHTQGMAAALSLMPWYYGPDPAPRYRDTCIRTGYGRDVVYHTPLVELWDIITRGTRQRRPRAAPTDDEWVTAIRIGLNVDAEDDEVPAEEDGDEDSEEMPPPNRAPDMADVFYTVPQAYNISRDPLFLAWLFPAHGISEAGVSITGCSPYADNSVALFGDTVVSASMDDFEAIHDLRRRGVNLEVRDLADRLLVAAYGRNYLVPQVPVSLFVASRRMEGFPIDLVPKYRTALSNISGMNEQEPVRAHTDRDSDFYKYSVLAW
ncbi:hypothetical protein GNI_062370 [Gregarina niphandrodes]|uniref:Uncharacterized protein n=1 Tax=Gregarina niphandrodes TaxID=110365 RepID=A0A023B864_GRENI|nr:hypothetical protein GNI_062370 [Gregarina niphandrodes]EZG68428.1 hypothetical protein GNI_062370 [Gregarina niphandrodes]|eukprot:XP_011134582.1 hypothetical protein GNI_062370 [Gregarina niphandrodes]